MESAFVLPRLVFGSGSLNELAKELMLLRAQRPLLISDRGLEKVGIVAAIQQAVPSMNAFFLDVPENPTAAGADTARRACLDAGCDSIVALGGGSVLDTAKLVAALVLSDVDSASDLIGKPHLIVHGVAPLLAIPTTVGTGSESSPVAALHIDPGSPAIGTRSSLMVPKVALCDPNLVRSLPKQLVAATALDALSHCIEGYFANPENPIIDALALDGISRILAHVQAALEPQGDLARTSLMAAAFAGGAAINKGLGPAHAVALVCSDQDVHHGTMIAVALPHTTNILAKHMPDKAARVAAAMGIDHADGIGEALLSLVQSLNLPTTLEGANYRVENVERMVAEMVQSPFSRTSPYAPSASDYRAVLANIST